MQNLSQKLESLGMEQKWIPNKMTLFIYVLQKYQPKLSLKGRVTPSMLRVTLLITIPFYLLYAILYYLEAKKYISFTFL